MAGLRRLVILVSIAAAALSSAVSAGGGNSESIPLDDGELLDGLATDLADDTAAARLIDDQQASKRAMFRSDLGN